MIQDAIQGRAELRWLRRVRVPAQVVALLSSRHAWLFVPLGLVAVYLIINFGLPRIPRSLISGFVKSFMVQPLLWTGLAALVYGVSHYGPPERRFAFSRPLLLIGLLLGAFQVSVLAIAGLFTAFGESPYTLRFPGVVYNLFFWSSALVAIELTRAYLLNLVGRRFLYKLTNYRDKANSVLVRAFSKSARRSFDKLPSNSSLCQPVL